MAGSEDLLVQVLHDPVFYSTYIVVKHGKEYLLIDLSENRAKIFQDENEYKQYIAKKVVKLATSIEDGLRELEKFIEKNIEVENVNID